MTTNPLQHHGPRRIVSRGLLAACALLLPLAVYCLAWSGDHLDAAPLSAPQSAEYPPLKLRGYGVLAGSFTAAESDGHAAGALRIVCADEEKAKLVLAKYLSDLQLLPGVEKIEPRGRPEQGMTRSSGLHLPVFAVKDQGFIVAARSAATVWILAAPTAAGLEKLIDQNFAAGTAPLVSTPEVRVPMNLDRWDKYGFRFYYGPFVKPQDADHHEVATYDPRQDFAFAKKSGDVGLVVWNSPYGGPSAEGIMNFNSRDWVFKAARQLKLPMGVNLGLEDNNVSLVNRYPNDMTPNADQYLGGWYGAINFGLGSTVAWSSDAVQDVALGQIQPLVRQLNHEDTVVNWLEPHEEMCHGVCDILDDHGPPARLNFHRFL